MSVNYERYRYVNLGPAFPDLPKIFRKNGPNLVGEAHFAREVGRYLASHL